MRPTTPVKAGLEKWEIVLAEDQPEYIPLPVLVQSGPEKRMTSRWSLSAEERQKVANGADIFLQQLTFGHPFQPVALGLEEDFFTPPEPSRPYNHIIDGCLCNGVGCVRCCGPS